MPLIDDNIYNNVLPYTLWPLFRNPLSMIADRMDARTPGFEALQ